jgi:cytochrome c oxidase subunit 1
MTGRMLNEKWGAIGFWTSQVGFQVTFMSLFAIGLAGLPRRDGDFPVSYATGNTVATIGAYVIMAGMLIYLGTLVWSWKYGETAPPNPWGAKTLEWQTPTPVPLENFEVLPVVTSDFYGYGEDAPAHPEPEPEPEPVPVGAVAASEPVPAGAVVAGEQEPGGAAASIGTATEEEQ